MTVYQKQRIEKYLKDAAPWVRKVYALLNKEPPETSRRICEAAFIDLTGGVTREALRPAGEAIAASIVKHNDPTATRWLYKTWTEAANMQEMEDKLWAIEEQNRV